MEHQSPATSDPPPTTRADGLFRVLHRLDRWLALPLRALVLAYRRGLSPLLPPACRFHPSCSAYAQQALEIHALPRALPLIAWRIARCQPMCRGGHDPVPLPRSSGPTGVLPPSPPSPNPSGPCR